MHIDRLEKIWLWIASLMALGMVLILAFNAIGENSHPPSNVETVDSTRLHLEGIHRGQSGCQEQ